VETLDQALFWVHYLALQDLEALAVEPADEVEPLDH
jgi:hypothetical protein